MGKEKKKRVKLEMYDAPGAIVRSFGAMSCMFPDLGSFLLALVFVCRSSWSRGGYSADNVVYGLIFANAAVFLLWRTLPREFMYKNFTVSL